MIERYIKLFSLVFSISLFVFRDTTYINSLNSGFDFSIFCFASASDSLTICMKAFLRTYNSRFFSSRFFFMGVNNEPAPSQHVNNNVNISKMTLTICRENNRNNKRKKKQNVVGGDCVMCVCVCGCLSFRNNS